MCAFVCVFACVCLNSLLMSIPNVFIRNEIRVEIHEYFIHILDIQNVMMSNVGPKIHNINKDKCVFRISTAKYDYEQTVAELV